MRSYVSVVVETKENVLLLLGLELVPGTAAGAVRRHRRC